MYLRKFKHLAKEAFMAVLPKTQLAVFCVKRGHHKKIWVTQKNCQLCFSPTNSSSGPPSDTPFPTMEGAACFFSTRRAVVEAEWVHDDQRVDSFQSKV